MISNVLSLLAIIIAAASFWNSRKANRTQEELTMREVELIRKQLAKIDRDERNSNIADIGANLYKLSRNSWKLRVFNKGSAIAYNVNMTTMAKSNSSFQQNFIDDILPMKSLEPGSNVEIPAVVTINSPLKEEIGLSWENSSGEIFEKTVEVTR